jgi:hypothetical protein
VFTVAAARQVADGVAKKEGAVRLGFAELLILAIPVALVAAAVVVVVFQARAQARRAKAFGYPTLLAYLRAAPRNDEEKRDATDLALKGLVICMVGFVFVPLLLVGLLPFFYGARKVVYASMGLGLADDSGNQPR